jgi:glucose-6-phosphate dehydrogenase assembly protein OpcA
MSANPATLPVCDVEKELSRQLEGAKEPGESPVQRAQMSNLVIFCDRTETAATITNIVPAIVVLHPARVLLLVGEPDGDSSDVSAEISVWCQRHRGGPKACSELVTLRARGQSVDRLPFAVRSLLIGDLPTNVWWVAGTPPPLAGPFLHQLAESAEQVVYDSIGWREPARAVAATAAWLEQFERPADHGPWRVASDLNWRRLKYWRRLTAQALDPAAAPGALDSITEVRIEHGPHAVVQAWLLASWLASRLKWRVQAGRVEPNVEIAWKVAAPHGPMRVVLVRASEGPSEVHRMRIAFTVQGKPSAFTFQAQGPARLAVAPENNDAAPRTLTVQPQPQADLVARQLSDRERDPVFRDSMIVAQVFARSVIG